MTRPGVDSQLRRNREEVPEIREANFADYSQISRLETQYGMETKSCDDWKHLWVNNPAYVERGAHWPIGWVLENKGQIVGHFGNIPLHYELGNRRILAATGRAWVVDERYRAYSICLLDEFLHQPDVDLFLNTSANQEAYAAFVAFGSLRVPLGDWDKCGLWLVSYRAFLKDYFNRTKMPLSGVLTYPLAAALFLKDRLMPNPLRTHAHTADVELCCGFDERFDAFWDSLRANNPGLFLAVRDRATLDWHFRSALLKNQVWILTITDGAKILAYSIFLVQHNLQSGLKRAVLADFQSLHGEQVLLPMLSWALRYCRTQGIQMVEVIGLCAGKARVANLAPYRRRRQSWSYLYKGRDPALTELLRVPDTWAPSLFDGDASL